MGSEGDKEGEMGRMKFGLNNRLGQYNEWSLLLSSGQRAPVRATPACVLYPLTRTHTLYFSVLILSQTSL